MAKGIKPEDPTRADHRLMVYMLKTFMGKEKVLHDPEEFERVTDVFARAGGSWVRLFQGSAKDLNLLRRILKIAAKNGFLTKAPQLG